MQRGKNKGSRKKVVHQEKVSEKTILGVLTEDPIPSAKENIDRCLLVPESGQETFVNRFITEGKQLIY